MSDDLHAASAIALSQRIARELHPLLQGHSPDIQGAALADLLATFLAGCAPATREEILALHIEMVRRLIPVNEMMMFGVKGHPAGYGH